MLQETLGNLLFVLYGSCVPFFLELLGLKERSDVLNRLRFDILADSFESSIGSISAG